MRVAVGALLFEGNTFSPVITTKRDFESKYLEEGEAIRTALAGTGTEIAGAMAAAARSQAELVPLLATHGGAGGRVSSTCHAELTRSLLRRLHAAGGVEGVYLALHGAFVAQGIDDVEGALLREVRQIVGGVPLVVSLDLHAHVTAEMLRCADALIGYQLYPHDDTFQTGERSMRLLVDIIAGRFRPVMRAVRAPMLLPAQRQRTHGNGPMARIHDLARAMENDGAKPDKLRAVSYFPVQPWMDFPAMGFTCVAVAETESAASAAAEQIVRKVWDDRRSFLIDVHEPARAVAAGLQQSGLVVLADAADCVGGGATGDSAHAIPALQRAAPAATAAIHVVDPETVQKAKRHRLGARFSAALGNKLDRSYGDPLPLDVELVSVSDGAFRYGGGLMRGVEATTGPTVVVRAGPVEILVGSLSAYEYGDEAFAANGIDPRRKKFVVVKNPMNYQAAYAEAAAQYVLDTPGPTTPNLARLPWRQLHRPTFPVDPDAPPRFVGM